MNALDVPVVDDKDTSLLEALELMHKASKPWLLLDSGDAPRIILADDIFAQNEVRSLGFVVSSVNLPSASPRGMRDAIEILSDTRPDSSRGFLHVEDVNTERLVKDITDILRGRIFRFDGYCVCSDLGHPYGLHMLGMKCTRTDRSEIVRA